MIGLARSSLVAQFVTYGVDISTLAAALPQLPPPPLRFLGFGNEHQEPPTVGQIVSVQALGGVVAGATASCITTPLDTIKTRLQVQIAEAAAGERYRGGAS